MPQMPLGFIGDTDIKPPENTPATPMPAIARPTMTAFEFFAVALTRHPTSKRARADKNVALAGKAR
jgi:hypothetical protein